MEKVRLGDVCILKTGKTPPTKEKKYFKGKINWYTPSDLGLAPHLKESIRTISNFAFEDNKAIQFESGTLLMTCIGEIGKLGITTEKSSSNQQITGLIPKKELDVKYLFYSIFKSKKNLQNLANNAVVPILNNKQLGNFQIPLPPLSEQKSIAEKLDKAQEIIRYNEEIIAKYDELTQSLFIDMFGDPVKNEKGWEKVDGSNLYKVKGRVGWKGYKKTDLRENGALVLGATHIDKYGYIDISKPVYLSNEKYVESPEIMIERNDLIFVQRGNTIGKIGLVREELGEATINPVVVILRPKVNSFFILYLLLNNGINNKILEINSGSAQPMITQKSMNEYKFINPPIELQNQFAERVVAIETQKQLAQESLTKSKDLFGSLLQESFR